MTTAIWPARTAQLAGLGVGIGLAIHALLPMPLLQPALGDLTIIAGLTTLGASFAIVLERTRLRLAIGFALLAAAVAAGASWFAGGTGGLEDAEVWRLVSAGIAIAIAAPLFQAWRDAGAKGHHIPYVAAHDRAWTNLVLVAAALAFLGVCWLLMALLAGLFDLIGIEVLTRLLDQRWFGLMLSGGALLGGIGLLRDQMAILSTLQRVLRFVLSVLAPVLALGLLLFLAALPVTGLAPLWQATRSTTPILLACVIGALVLANAIIADQPGDESRSRLLRLAALLLALALLPLAGIAAVSVARRIGQYGLSPDRLWAVTFVGVAMLYGVVYAGAVLRRAGWMADVRRGNLGMGVLLCGVALLLSTPLIDFGALSTRSQLARLESGRVSPADFDWAALRYDFGAKGRRALTDLGRSRDPAIADRAREALKTTNRWDARRLNQPPVDVTALQSRLRILPAGAVPPLALLRAIAGNGECNGKQTCVLLIDKDRARLFQETSNDVYLLEWRRTQAGPTEDWQLGDEPTLKTPPPSQHRPLADATIEVRTVERRQLFVDGKPVAEWFE
ncbi:MAG: DUF4153 domain-containing protein [Alphaproteobacteria bacterium PA4]|nr:MAG: DUF4153 domain-containing protein [Alphaproteobacteria bacterium PA4]